MAPGRLGTLDPRESSEPQLAQRLRFTEPRARTRPASQAAEPRCTCTASSTTADDLPGMSLSSSLTPIHTSEASNRCSWVRMSVCCTSLRKLAVETDVSTPYLGISMIDDSTRIHRPAHGKSSSPKAQEGRKQPVHDRQVGSDP